MYFSLKPFVKFYILGYIDSSMINLPTCMSSLIGKSGNIATKNSIPITKVKTLFIIDENMIKINVCHNIRLHLILIKI